MTRNWRHIFKNALPLLLVLTAFCSTAQEDRLNRAQQLYRAKNVAEAIPCIDSVVRDPQTSKDFIAWTNRAYIYFDAYKVKDKQKLNSALRDTIVSSIRMSNRLQPDSAYAMNNKKLLMNLSANYFNIAKSLLQDSVNAERSAMAYTQFKDLYKVVEPNADFSTKDVEYYLAVGSVFSGIAIKDNNDTKSQNTAKVALLKVLEIQQDNPAANINMGLMYYNQAANLSKSLEYGADFSQIDIVQDNMVKLAKQAEQFIYKVYMNDNKNLKAVEALYYIYRMLSENAKSDEFKKKGEELGIKYSVDENLSNDKKDK
ncbi:MAG: hypothetical protein JNL60_00730 [Bacteroidia bacterium]|nr:hypothetical protein [Bacteroidia bacterium]